MSGFKLIAIRPLIGCDRKFLKNLKECQIYKFYNDFQFLDKDGLSINNLNFVKSLENKIFSNEVDKIEYDSVVPEGLYNLNSINSNTIDVNISAIVGKNGSGKSTIVELFSLFIFCLSNQLDLINIEKFKKNHNLNHEDIKRLETELNSFESFNCELYYFLEKKIYCITKDGNIFSLRTFEASEESNKKQFELISDSNIDLSKKLNEIEKIDFLRDSFFYSILANYSLYGLNTNEIGIWLKSIFHKNDGYQTPIVLNPMRTEGLIDINRLTYLSKSRLLTNLFRKLEDEQKEEDSLRNLVNNKIVNKLILKLDLNKFKVVEDGNLKTDQIPKYLLKIDEKYIYLEYTEKYKENHLSILISAFFPKYPSLDIIDSSLKKISIEYILRKAFDIIKTYPEYKNYSKRVFRTNSIKDVIKECFDKLATDYTHSTFKIRQAINFLIHNFYDLSSSINKEYLLSTKNKKGITDIINENIENFIAKDKVKLDQNFKINNDIDYEYNMEIIYKKHYLINYLPPSFFEIDFEFNENGFFKDLSSGEKQMIYSINSIIYHLLNLKSIESEERITYKYFNIVLDEIEICFHPEFQRIFTYELLRSINSTNMLLDGVNIVFLTHSPFILSDIPSANILHLDNGNILKSGQETFGSNIHDLLANDFFLENGFMGEFTKNEINKAIEHLNVLKISNNIQSLETEIRNSTSKSKQEQLQKKLKSIDIIKNNRLLNLTNLLDSKYNSEYCRKLIELVGEPLLASSLMELYVQAYPSEKDDFIQYQIERLIKLKG
ncbi:AAA family ATPase [Flavobacterium piscis]|nr:AAA family ATPase [Flavobacterium piscis]